MTARQTAVAAGADLKWLTNSAALLRRPIRYHSKEAKWWGLVRLLVDRLGLTLKAAAGAATEALRAPDSRGLMDAGADPSGSAALVVDLPRYESVFLANLSRALVLETPRRRGRTTRHTTRDAVSAASRYGVDIDLVRSALGRSPAERLEMLDANVAFVRAMKRAAK
jgi:hypothetical protein